MKLHYLKLSLSKSNSLMTSCSSSLLCRILEIPLRTDYDLFSVALSVKQRKTMLHSLYIIRIPLRTLRCTVTHPLRVRLYTASMLHY